ncbi:MAG: sulfite exporter TauE/SafE family protein [Opitutae bacterium]|nr:sulfite exporter TauE/SafE family protein [Opitutae bacterium]
MNPEFHAYTLSAPQLGVLLASVAGVAIVHTLAGPDHYIPFIAMARARGWSQWRTAVITLLCGVGHVGSSIILALVGVVFGLGLQRIQFIEELRGNIAAWALIAFGAVYLAWGLKRALRNRPHSHHHAHEDGAEHAHAHTHSTGHAHAHSFGRRATTTPWVLFTIFVFGPCEPMIPLVMYPAAQGSWANTWLVVVVFSVLTLLSMLGVVLLGLRGVRLIPFDRFERFSHAAAGATVMIAGCAIAFLGL